MSIAAKETGCVFCDAILKENEPSSLILARGKHNFILLNRYPYNNGHLMIAPYEHVMNPADVDPVVVEEMMRLSQDIIRAMREVYHPDGFNLGMNLGRCAGAGIESHYHLHVVPRWNGDTNFMTTLAETRVLPEDFATTLSKLKPYFP